LVFVVKYGAIFQYTPSFLPIFDIASLLCEPPVFIGIGEGSNRNALQKKQRFNSDAKLKVGKG